MEYRPVSYATLTNVAELLAAYREINAAPMHHPRLGCFFGWAGLGKSTAAAVVNQKENTIYVEVKSVWTTKYFLEQIAKEVGIKDLRRTIPHLQEAIIEEINHCGRGLIIDEVDHVLRKEAMIEVIRDIHESTNVPILLIGEEALPEKLHKWQKVHSRVLRWIPASALSPEDATKIRDAYCQAGMPKIEDDLIEEFRIRCKGNARYIVVNIHNAQELARQSGWESVSLEQWGKNPINDGEFHRG